MKSDYIEINGAKTHNLKNICVNIPKNKLVVVSGKSGSGKSTLIMNTLFKYAKKNYLDALSNNNYSADDAIDYEVNYIKNIQPPVAVEQRRRLFNNPRSTIGTLTGIDGFLRIIFSVYGKPVCPVCYQAVDEELFCDECGCYAEELTPKQFSPSTKEGMCLKCSGIGQIIQFTEDKIIPDRSKTLKEIWDTAKKNTFNIPSNKNVFEKLMEHYNIIWDTPYNELSKEFQNKLLYGSEEVFTIKLNKVTNQVNHLGIITYLDNQYKKTNSISRRKDLEIYLDISQCSECNGGKLKKESLMVTVENKSYFEVQNMPFYDLLKYLDGMGTSKQNKAIGSDVVEELMRKVKNICELSVGYLSVNRQVSTLSGGELQRILISQHLSSDLTGVMYILDEPTMGLHDSDVRKIIETMKRLKDMGNSVIVIEHDEQVIEEADYTIEVGPKAGIYGGEILAAGSIDEVMKNDKSLAKKYTRNRQLLRERNKAKQKIFEINNINKNNLKNISVKIPANALTCVTGVSGCGKSSLIEEIYDTAWIIIKHGIHEVKHVNNFKDEFEDVLYIDQNPIKGSSRSNIMTYIGFNDNIRNLFYEESVKLGMDINKSFFSTNIPGGRCEKCHGNGEVEVDMYFLSNETIECDECHGKRFKNEILQVKHYGLDVSEIYELSVQEAYDLFIEGKNETIIKSLQYLIDFGLGYLKLGQTTDSLSGGEAQRLHLITELMKGKKKKTLFIFDEPSCGLHYSDTEYLIRLFDELIAKGHTVIVIEHNMDIIFNADYVIDLGPEAGQNGGALVYQGKTEDFLNCEEGYTASCLRKHVNMHYA